MLAFKYDVVTLIELVKSRPCLWDKTNENNKNKILRDESWREIFQFLENDYDRLPETEKKKTAEIIVAKWCNLRDAFTRSIRKKLYHGSKKRYKYSHHLQFLLKGQSESSFSQSGTQDDSNEFEEFTESQLQTDYSQYIHEPVLEVKPLLTNYQSTSADDLLRSKRRLDDVNQEMLTEPKRSKLSIDSCFDNSPFSHNLSDQELLVLSFLPYIRDMDESELIDFQIKVLSAIKEIKQKRV